MPVSALVLVHSPLVGPSTWRGVSAGLAAAGYTTVVVDLAGAHTPSTITEAVVRSVPAEVTQTVLIGHSGAGPFLPTIADALGTVTATVYVDAGLPRPGLAWADEADPELVAHLESMVDGEGLLPPWSEWFGPEAIAEVLPDRAQRDAFVAAVPRLPWSSFTEPAPPAQWSGPRSYVLLSEAYRGEAETVRAAGDPVVECLSDHLAPLTRTAEVVLALSRVLVPPSTGLVFGPHALTYDDVRPGYPPGLVDEALAYAGEPSTVVEVGAGTGKATEAFASRGVELICVEPDHDMAAVLRRRFADRPHVTVVESFFEGWAPPAGGVDLLTFALSWHWTDPATRLDLVHAALRPGGALALLDHVHRFADDALEARLNEAYDEHAPGLRAESLRPDAITRHTTELATTDRFTDVRTHRVITDVPYPTRRYIRLLQTFSIHIRLPAGQREALHARIAELVDAAGGEVVVRLDTTLVLARRR